MTKKGTPIRIEEYKPEVIGAMDEAKRISKDPDVKRYNSFSEALKDMDICDVS